MHFNQIVGTICEVNQINNMHVFDIIIETPKGHNEKFNFDPGSGGFKLKKMLPAGMVFPCDFGFIPHTKGEDGDPLDALVFSEIKSFPGCIMECRLIGAFICEQQEKQKMIRNDRYLFVPTESKQFAAIKKIKDLDNKMMDEIKSFFRQYNELEGKEFKVIKEVVKTC